MTAYPIFDTIAEHGEGPIWDPIEQYLYWVDIMQGKYYKGDPANETVETFEVGQPLGVLALREKGGIVMAVRDGFGFYEPTTQEFKLIEPSPEQHNDLVRFNDGAVDPAGRFFAGTMAWEPENRLGKLFRLDTDHTWHPMEDQLYITNGMGWNKDASTYFMIDTPSHVMYAYDYDLNTGNIQNRRPHITFEETVFPDGMCMDAEDGFWVAIWEGAKVIHFDAAGKKVEEIALPVTHPTSCCFGGPDLSTLFISTSNIALSEAQKQEYPLAGRTFRVETSAKGRVEPRFKG